MPPGFCRKQGLVLKSAIRENQEVNHAGIWQQIFLKKKELEIQEMQTFEIKRF